MSRARSLALGAAAMLLVSVSPSAVAETKPSAASRLSLVGAQTATGVCTTRPGMDGLYRRVGEVDYRCTNRVAEWRNAGFNSPCVKRPGVDDDWREEVTTDGLRWARCGSGFAGWLPAALVATVAGLVIGITTSNSSPGKSP